MSKLNIEGTWKLKRFWFTDDLGTEVDPLGSSPTGNLILGSDHYFAFTIMRVDRSAYESGDLLSGTVNETSEAANGYVSFGGTWSLKEEFIHFEIAYSLFPNWVNGVQKRQVSVTGDKLLLQTTAPILMAGKIHQGAARWQRLSRNNKEKAVT